MTEKNGRQLEMMRKSCQPEDHRKVLVQAEREITAHSNKETNSVRSAKSRLNEDFSTLKATVASGELHLTEAANQAKYDDASKHVEVVDRKPTLYLCICFVLESKAVCGADSLLLGCRERTWSYTAPNKSFTRRYKCLHNVFVRFYIHL